MCNMPESDLEKLLEIAEHTTDRLLANGILLLIRGDSLPYGVAQALLNSGAALMDAVDMTKRIIGRH
jgi:hypothetical protein